VLTTQGSLGQPGADIIDVYHTFVHPAGGDAFLYLAMTRAKAEGAFFLTFELNQKVGPNPDGTWTNAAGHNIPCRSTGDILISFRFHPPGDDVFVQEWIDGRLDPATGCAETGTLENVDERDGLNTTVVQGAFNSGTIQKFLPTKVNTSGNGGAISPTRDNHRRLHGSGDQPHEAAAPRGRAMCELNIPLDLGALASVR
jgi:hypothetical protein